MQLEERITKLKVSDQVRFFLQAWYSMVHARSLDSHRVRCMTPPNITRELSSLLSKRLPKIAFDQEMVAHEALRIQAADPILQTAEYRAYWQPVEKLIKEIFPENSKSKDVSEQKQQLILYYLRDLLYVLEARYKVDVLNALEEELLNAAGAFERIFALTNSLLSTLLDEGYSLEALFALLRHIFLYPTKAKTFDAQFKLLRRVLTAEQSSYRVIFPLDGVSKPETLTKSFGVVAFSQEVENLDTKFANVSKLLTPGQNRLFANTTVMARDDRAAGATARLLLEEVLDLICFEFERLPISVSDEFVCYRARNDGTPQPDSKLRVFALPDTVPNPRRNVAPDELRKFVESVNKLLDDKKLTEESRNRIRSAFRLYRMGRDANNLEHKILNWWTALEYLVRGRSGEGPIAEAVRDSLTPVLCLDYVRKYVDSYARALSYAEVTHPVEVGGPLCKPMEVPLRSLVVAWRIPEIQKQVIDGVADYPVLSMRMSQFFGVLATPQKILTALEDHERRLRWHIQRIWRTRCDIVHSAERTLRAQLLCANLEYYLQSLLAMLFDDLANNPLMNTPREFFDRRERTYAWLKLDLAAGNDSNLLDSLQNRPW